MGREATLVRRERRHVWPFLSRRGAMAGCHRKSATPESHGAGHDIFHAAQFLLLRRRVRWLLARLDLDEHRAGSSPAQESVWPEDLRRGRANLEARTRTLAEFSAAPGSARFQRGRAVLLRVARASANRSLVGLGGVAQQIRPRARRGAQSFRLVR